MVLLFSRNWKVLVHKEECGLLCPLGYAGKLDVLPNLSGVLAMISEQSMKESRLHILNMSIANEIEKGKSSNG
jgi:hypothetical protein